MPQSNSSLAFDDVRGLFDKALEAPRGIRVTCPDHGKAIALRARLNYFRTLDRQDNAKTYETEHFMWNKSAYDRLVLRVPKKGEKDDHILYIGPRTIDFQIEEIPDVPAK